jgi:hypothetical protein
MADALKASMATLLGAERNGTVLPRVIVDVLVEYFVQVVEVKDVQEVDISNILEDATDAWARANDGDELPPFHVRKLSAFAGIKSSKNEVKKLGDLKAPSIRLDEEDEDDLDVLFGDSGASDRELDTLQKDKDAQGISGARRICLSVGLELGRAPIGGEVLGKVFYGSHVTPTDLIKRNRKAGVKMLNSILNSGSNVRRDLSVHFGNLVRDYSGKQLIMEASLVTQWWAETQTISHDDKVLAAYITEYFMKYPGRGLPTTIDVVIATRVTGSMTGGVSTDALKEVKDSFKTQIAQLKTEVGNLRSELGKVKKNPNPKKPDAKKEGEKTGKGPKCWKCGEIGHYAADCPNAKEDKEEVEDDE